MPKRSRYLLMLLAATAMLCSEHPDTRAARPLRTAATQAPPLFSRELAHLREHPRSRALMERMRRVGGYSDGTATS